MVEALKELIQDDFLRDYGLVETDLSLQVEGKIRSCKTISLDGKEGRASSKYFVAYLVDRIEGKQTLYLRIYEEVSELTQEQYRVAAAYIHASISAQEEEIRSIRFNGSLEVSDDALQAFWNIKPPGRGRVKKEK